MTNHSPNQRTSLLRQLGVQAVVSLGIFSLGVYAVLQGLNLGIGTLGHPGGGFTALLFGGFMAVLALLSFAEAYVKERNNTAPTMAHNGGKYIIVVQLLVLASIVGYVFLITRLGYIVSTFLFVSIVTGLISGRVLLAPIVGAGVSLVAYVVFGVLLNVRLPL